MVKEEISRKSINNWYPAIVVMLVIFVASSTPGQIVNAVGFTKESYHVDAHFLLFFLLCIAYFKAVKNVGLSWILTAIYAFTDELHQHFTPLRSVSFEDIVVDVVAGLVAILIIWKLQPILPKKLKAWLNN